MNTWCHSISVTFKFWCWVPRESVLRGSSAHKATCTAQNLKVTLIEWLLKLTLLEWHQVFRPNLIHFFYIQKLSWWTKWSYFWPILYVSNLHSTNFSVIPSILIVARKKCKVQNCFFCAVRLVLGKDLETCYMYIYNMQPIFKWTCLFHIDEIYLISIQCI